MKKSNKKALYESIMKDVAKVVYKRLNEEWQMLSVEDKRGARIIKDYDKDGYRLIELPDGRRFYNMDPDENAWYSVEKGHLPFEMSASFGGSLSKKPKGPEGYSWRDAKVVDVDREAGFEQIEYPNGFKEWKEIGKIRF